MILQNGMQDGLPEKEIEDYPCGCTGQMERGGQKKLRLLVRVKENCPFDSSRIGQVMPHVRYAAQNQGATQ